LYQLKVLKMSLPKELKYTRDHEWVKDDGKKSLIGVTAFAIEQLGDIVHIDLPAVGDVLAKGDSFGTIESTKTVSDLYMPSSGTITRVNEDLVSNLETLHESPYDNGWLVEVEGGGDSEELLDAAGYQAYLEQQ
jgi:glycine cleavage system H protein